MRAAAGPTHEGSVIVVPPSNSDRRIRHYKSCASLHVQGRIGHPRHRREALGGWFAFGAADRIRYTMEKFLERLRSTMPAGAATAGDDASLGVKHERVPGAGHHLNSALPKPSIAEIFAPLSMPPAEVAAEPVEVAQKPVKTVAKPARVAPKVPV